MKKILSFAAIALFSFTVLFSACNSDTSSQTEEQTPATEEAAPAPAETQEAAAPAADTTQVQ